VIYNNKIYLLLYSMNINFFLKLLSILCRVDPSLSFIKARIPILGVVEKEWRLRDFVRFAD